MPAPERTAGEKPQAKNIGAAEDAEHTEKKDKDLHREHGESAESHRGILIIWSSLP